MSRLYFSPNVFLVEFLSRLILLSANLWGLTAPFPGGDHGWLAREVSFTVPTGLTATKLSVYTMYRNDPNPGVAYFDDIEIIVIPPAPCVSLLKEFVTVCNPEVQSCSTDNDQTYQLTIDEIVESVNTDTKLDLTVIHDKLDTARKLLGLDGGHLSCDVKCYFIYVLNLILIALASFNSYAYLKHSQR